MSADNWRECPLCLSEQRKKARELGRKMSDSYGKIPVDDFNVLQQEHAQALSESDYLPETLREDYEFFINDDGNFFANYYAMCDNCGFKFEFHHVEKIKITAPESEGEDA